MRKKSLKDSGRSYPVVSEGLRKYFVRKEINSAQRKNEI